MKATPEFYFDPETRVATCALREQNGRGYVGMAMCHPEDEDMMSEKTGCEIALRRMEIEALRAYRRDELEPGLKALKQLYYSMKHSGQFNKKSYEAKMLFRQMNQKQEDIDFIKEIIAQRKEELKDFIDRKDEFYKKTRKGRELKAAVAEMFSCEEDEEEGQE